MADCFITRRGGGGSGGLNFEIVGGTTQPTNPKENTIWINTDEEITGWVFSAAEPEAPAAGMVWIKTGLSSNVQFNALKKNQIILSPIYATQYTSDGIVDKQAQIYQNGEWVDWRVFLYNKGNMFEEITGGWKMLKHVDYSNGSVSILEDSIKLVGGSGAPSMITTYKIDLTDVKTVNVNAKEIYGSARLIARADYVSSSANVTAMNTFASTGVHQIDVSGLTGSYYILIMSDGVSFSGRYIVFDSVWIE